MSAPRPGSVGVVDQAGEARSAPVESLRAVAALSVLLGHVVVQTRDRVSTPVHGDLFERALTGGTFGVALFFGLSGYLLYLPFARRDFAAGRDIDLSRYGLNRMVRILPLYYVCVVVLLLSREGGGSWSQWWRFLLFAQNFSVDTLGAVNGVLWSIVVELHFYALLPLLALAVGRVADGSRETAVAFLCAVGAASYLLYGLSDDTRWRTSLPALLFFFVAGMLVALFRLSWEERRPAWLRGPAASSTAWFLASLPIWAVVSWRHELAALTAVAAFLVVGAVALPLQAGRLSTVLGWRPLALVGVASYSLYMWHLPLIEVAARDAGALGTPGGLLAVVLPLSLLAAGISYLAIESPFLRLRRHWGSTPWSATG